MWDTSARLLKLLSLLQARREWTGPELAERLGVTTRTVRNDVERLRGLGYPVHASPGVAGGYRLGAGAALPPLLLDDEEAVAVVVGLRTAAGGVTGIEETSVRALAKLQQVLPSRLRRRVDALAAYTVPVPGAGPTVDAEVLTTIAAACRDHERLRFDYRTHSGGASRRDTEPHRLVHRARRWYLVAWDVERADWRTFRVDRMAPRTPSGPRFTPRELPSGGDIANHVNRGVDTATWRYRASVTVLAPAGAVRARLPASIEVEPVSDDRCRIEVGSDDPGMLAAYLGMLDADFVLDTSTTGQDAPGALRDALRAHAHRLLRAAD
ncbi:MAG: helix-turn-helix transcriptional regulator [Micromonosporaceae bacterium]